MRLLRIVYQPCLERLMTLSGADDALDEVLRLVKGNPEVMLAEWVPDDYPSGAEVPPGERAPVPDGSPLFP